MKKLTFILLVLVSFAAKSQKIESIYFNLYTDSLKKGVYNYINVDGKLDNGKFLPLMSDEVVFTSTSGKWDGNSLIIDRTGKVDSVIITAALKNRPEVKKSVTIHVKKIEFDPPLKTEEELLDEWRKKGKKKN
ncbi:MAG: hypothetical protein JWQ09_5580 [Segetibacter sp.]|nr:hypothetical protein [Segetibacter sp.]